MREVATAFDGLSLAHHVSADVPHEVAAFVDAGAVYQVLGHLLDNAIKYSPDGGAVTIRLSGSAGSATIDVIDEGIGLPPAVNAFEPFRRGDPEDPGTPGVGLGLHIVRNLVEAMGGTVSARTNPEAGSTFTVTLPPGGPEHMHDTLSHPDAIITLAYHDAAGRLVDSELLHVSPAAGSVWIKPSETILSWPTVRTVRASLARSPITPIDIKVHLLPPACPHAPVTEMGHPERF